jgi:hypothetical protein
MAEDLLGWRRQSPYPIASDYIFASPFMKGTQPYWPENLMKCYIGPVAHEAGIYKNIGWHTFRHSFGTMGRMSKPFRSSYAPQTAGSRLMSTRKL